MRKLAAALLAVPVIAMLYVPVLVRRSIAARVGLAIGVGGLVALGALGLVSPAGTTATKPLPAIVPLTQAEFTSTIAADQQLDSPVDLAFSGPMDQTSVAASLDVAPPTAVRLAWDPTGTRVTVSPDGHWLARHVLHDHRPSRRPRRRAAGRWRFRPGRSSSPAGHVRPHRGDGDGR